MGKAPRAGFLYMLGIRITSQANTPCFPKEVRGKSLTTGTRGDVGQVNKLKCKTDNAKRAAGPHPRGPSAPRGSILCVLGAVVLVVAVVVHSLPRFS